MNSIIKLALAVWPYCFFIEDRGQEWNNQVGPYSLSPAHIHGDTVVDCSVQYRYYWQDAISIQTYITKSGDVYVLKQDMLGHQALLLNGVHIFGEPRLIKND